MEDRFGVDLVVMVDEFVVIVVVFVLLVVTVVPVGTGKVVGTGGGDWWDVGLDWSRRPDVRELEVDVVEVGWGGRTSVRVALVGVDVLVLARDEVEVVEAAYGRRCDLFGVDLLGAQHLRLRPSVGTPFQQRSRRAVKGMLPGLHLGAR